VAGPRPHRCTGSPVIGAIGDLRRSKAALVLENALLRKQLSILGRRDTDPGQSWRNFVSNHHRQLWACDFVQVRELLFRASFAFFIIDVPTRRVVHVGITRCPTDRWVAQQ